MFGVELRGAFLGEVSILSGVFVSFRGSDDDLSSLETSDTDGNVIGFARGVLGVIGCRTMVVTRLAVRRIDCRTFHCLFLATKKRIALAAVQD
jgi:hypothetical protein